jgi:hypothetical protein
VPKPSRICGIFILGWNTYFPCEPSVIDPPRPAVLFDARLFPRRRRSSVRGDFPHHRFLPSPRPLLTRCDPRPAAVTCVRPAQTNTPRPARPRPDSAAFPLLCIGGPCSALPRRQTSMATAIPPRGLDEESISIPPPVVCRCLFWQGLPFPPSCAIPTRHCIDVGSLPALIAGATLTIMDFTHGPTGRPSIQSPPHNPR